MFIVNGKLVNHAGQEINKQGQVIEKAKPEGDTTDLQQQLQTVTEQLQDANNRIAELEDQLDEQGDDQGDDQGERGDPDSTDVRKNDELKAALTAAGVQYDSRANKAALQALAVQHGV